jgi:two-component system chemotaxis response regulator CheB
MLVIGASAGGVDALLQLLRCLPLDSRLPIVVLLHLSASGESRLPEVFRQHLIVPVQQARDKEKIDNGVVYFAGPGYHLSIEKDRSFSLSCEEMCHYSRPAIDILMSSAADACGRSLAAILLTGASRDGAEGMAAVKSEGGITIVQDPREAEVSTMPQAAIDRCLPDAILPLSEIGFLIKHLGDATCK